MTIPPRTSAHARLGDRIRQRCAERGVSSVYLAKRLGVSDTQVRYWWNGNYIPPLDMAERLSELLDDQRILALTVAARQGRCPVCDRPFERQQKSKRVYCSTKCQVRANYRTYPDERKFDPRQVAIDAMCKSCEPEGTCHDGSCALRPYSPLLVVYRRTA